MVIGEVGFDVLTEIWLAEVEVVVIAESVNIEAVVADQGAGTTDILNLVKIEVPHKETGRESIRFRGESSMENLTPI